ncbi:MAG: nuclear transport factor 2 family protein [Pseudomonadota bacterium]
MTITTLPRTLASAFILGAISSAVLSPALADTGGATADKIAVQTEEAKNAAIVRAAFDSWRSGGNVFTALLSDDIVWTIAGSGPVAGTYRGMKDFIDRASAPLVTRLASPVVPDVRAIWADGDRVIVRFDGTATTTSGAPYRNQFVWIFRMRNGKAVEAEAFLDLAAYQQVVDNNAPRAQ